MIEVSRYISSDGWVFLLTPRTKILLVLPHIHKKRINNYKYRWRLPLWSYGRESACQCSRHMFDTWSGKILHAVEHLSPGTTATEPAHARGGAPRKEKPPQWEACALQLESSIRSPQRETACVQQHRLSAAKIKYIYIHIYIYKDMDVNTGSRTAI